MRWSHANGWGLARWARPVLEVVFDGVAEAAEYQLRRLCRHENGSAPRYHRLQSELPTASGALDDASRQNVAALEADAEQLMQDEQHTLQEIYAALAHRLADREGVLA